MTTIPEVLVQKIFNRAAETGDLVTIEKTLKLKIWVDFYGKDRENALIKASKNAQSKVIEMLAARGSDLNFQDNFGYTPLHHLAKTLSVKTEASVIALKNGKADFNLYDFAGDTPVFIAAKALNLEGVKLLLKHGSSYDYTDVDGNSILMPFTRAGNFKAVRELLALGVNPSIENDDGDTIYDLGFPRR
jgi:ankyrin repeat protein